MVHSINIFFCGDISLNWTYKNNTIISASTVLVENIIVCPDHSEILVLVCLRNHMMQKNLVLEQNKVVKKTNRNHNYFLHRLVPMMHTHGYVDTTQH